MKTYTVLYSFDGRKYWGDVRATSLTEARKLFAYASTGQNVEILDVFLEAVTVFL
jgi:hypothetical protein